MDAVEEVKNRLSIEDVIGEYVQLRRAGRNFKGLSPFADERTPSFVVSPEKQIWHDFSSGKGGNIYSFIMEVEGLDFKGALELLARKAGVDLEQFRGKNTAGGNRGPSKERLYDLLELATKFYQVQFSQNQIALEYIFKKRQFTKETALEWRLGYSPNNGDALIIFAKSKGFSEEEIKQAGLSSQRYNGGVGDMFRGRLMVPLQDQQGRVIGFTARQLDDNPNAPKYINTPQTVLYDKSRHIYGLHLAKETIRKSQFVVITEGNLDVIMSHQAGVRQVIATAGTALTEPHLKALSRFTGDIRLSFDADKAGVAATERAIPIASRVKVSLSMITIPSGKDPDELIKQDADIWRAVISKNQYALDWLIERYQTLLDITSAEGKRKFSDELLPVVKSLADAVERDHYMNTIAGIIGVSRDALEQKMVTTTEQTGPKIQKTVKTTTVVDRVSVELERQQDTFLCLMLVRPTLREFLTIMEPEMFHTVQASALFVFLKENPDFYDKPEQLAKLWSKEQATATTDEERQLTVQVLQDYVKIQSLLYEELYQGLELNELHYEAARLQARLVEQFVKIQKQALVSKFDTSDEEMTRALLGQVKQYDQLLNQLKGNARG